MSVWTKLGNVHWFLIEFALLYLLYRTLPKLISPLCETNSCVGIFSNVKFTVLDIIKLGVPPCARKKMIFLKLKNYPAPHFEIPKIIFSGTQRDSKLTMTGHGFVKYI